MFNPTDVYRTLHTVRWVVESPNALVEEYRRLIREFPRAVGIGEDQLVASKEGINLGGTFFGVSKANAVVTSLIGSGLYAVSFGVPCGPVGVHLVTLSCMQKLPADQVDPAATARFLATASVAGLLAFEFMDRTVAFLHEYAIGKILAGATSADVR